MGNIFGLKPKRGKKMPKNIFEQEKQKFQSNVEEATKNADPKNKRTGKLMPAANERAIPSAPVPDQDMNIPSAPPTQVYSYEDAALDKIRYQLKNDAEAFLLNNILLSVQFFENYEREKWQIKNKVINKEKYQINDAMIRYNKHVLFGDSLMECINEHVCYQRSRGLLEAIAFSRIYIIHDNVEVRELGDASDYSAALDVPYYKLQIEDSKKPGYLKLKKQEVLESNVKRDVSITKNEFNDTDETFFSTEDFSLAPKLLTNNNRIGKHFNNQNSLCDEDSIQSDNKSKQLITETDMGNQHFVQLEVKPKSILKSNTTRYIKANDNIQSFTKTNRLSNGSEYESSGYGSILSGSSTVTESAVPKRIELHTKYASSSGVLLDECWTTVVKYVKKSDKDGKMIDSRKIDSNSCSDEDCDEIIDAAYTLRKSSSQTLYKCCYYLNSRIFMNNFIANFKQDLGKGLGFSQDAIMNALTHGATIYCDTFKNHLKFSYEIIPGLIAKWPNAANEWIIRSRKIIEDPYTNKKYQWPEAYMVNDARDFGCVLVPLGTRPNLASTSGQKVHCEQKFCPEQQWRITFPTAEQYLESCLAHSHLRCYLFTLILHKTFIENEMAIGIDASHIKHHLFRECEKNFAKWPENRLGESLMLFLKNFYTHISKSTLPNYYMDRCNEFENISSSVLRVMQRKLKNILEAPVMHILHAIDKLKYNSIGFYPPFNCHQLFEILTCENPLYLANSNFLAPPSKHEERRKQRRKINPSIKLSKSLDTERRHLALKLFIPHFIAMARSSEKFEAVNQAMIYLEQAYRLCLILLEEPGGDVIAFEYLNVIRDKLADCQRKIEKQKLKKTQQQQDIKLRPRSEPTSTDCLTHVQKKQNINEESVVSQNSPTETRCMSLITKEDINENEIQRENSVKNNIGIQKIIVADVHVERKQKSNKTKVNKASSYRFNDQAKNLISGDCEIRSPAVGNIDLEKKELKPSVTKDPSVTVVNVSVHKQENGTVQEDHGISNNYFVCTELKEQITIIQLNDSDIEESYL